MTEHPITPPLELVEQLRNDAPHGIRDAGVTRERQLAIAAYRAGADQQLETLLAWLRVHHELDPEGVNTIRAAMRPKPPSLAEEALDTLGTKKLLCFDHPEGYNIIHRALKRLQELESNG